MILQKSAKNQQYMPHILRSGRKPVRFCAYTDAHCGQGN